MRKIILAVLSVFSIAVDAQVADNITFSTYVGTGLSMSTPSSTPFLWQVMGHYNVNSHFAAGIGTGISVYEKTLVPLYADVKYNISKPHKFVPYVECGIGYGFAFDKNTNGGFYLSPSLGVQYTIGEKRKILFSIGYELQELERLKRYNDKYVNTEFQEHLSHSSICFKIGYAF